MINLTESIALAFEIFGKMPKKILVNPNVTTFRTEYKFVPVELCNATDDVTIIL